jgi:hypothetical protein
MKSVVLGQEEIPFCALSLLTMTSLHNPWALGYQIWYTGHEEGNLVL